MPSLIPLVPSTDALASITDNRFAYAERQDKYTLSIFPGKTYGYVILPRDCRYAIIISTDDVNFSVDRLQEGENGEIVDTYGDQTTKQFSEFNLEIKDYEDDSEERKRGGTFVLIQRSLFNKIHFRYSHGDVAKITVFPYGGSENNLQHKGFVVGGTSVMDPEPEPEPEE